MANPFRGRLGGPRAVLAAVVTAAAAGAAGAAGAQETAFERLDVSLWPEYDRPSMLVILRITLAESFAPPGTVRVRIPASAGQPNAVAEADATDNLVVATYEQAIVGEWSELTIDARYRRLQVEYYDPIERDGARRSYRWAWVGEQAVAEAVIDVQEPVDTVEMRVAPATSGPLLGADGLTRQRLDLGALVAGEERVVSLDWVRDSDALSAESLAPAPSAAPPPPPGTGAVSARTPSFWYRLILGLAAAAIAGGLAYWLVFVRGAEAGDRADERARTSRRAAPARRFCGGCGAAVQGSDRFCHACGRELG